MNNRISSDFFRSATALRLVICIIAGSVPLRAENLRLSQIDPGTILMDQQVKLYVSVTDETGHPVKNAAVDNFTVSESADGLDYQRIPKIESFRSMINYEAGINFILMVDNSGSMYRRMKADGSRRIDHAMEAIRNFLRNMSNPLDRVGLVSYNTGFTIHSDPVQDKSAILSGLDKIAEPVGDEGYTEIYGSLDRAMAQFKSVGGRKVLIILSDGENRSYFQNTGRKHEIFGAKVYGYEEPLQACQKEGISVFAINYGTGLLKKDRHLQDIALQSGGAVFSAENRRDLSGVYSTIVNQLLNEYYITYRATMTPTDRKYVKVEYRNGERSGETGRFYFSSTVFGIPVRHMSPLFLLPLLLALLLAWLLSRIKFINTPGEANLSILNSGKAQASTKVLSLRDGKTVIGSGRNADMTITDRLTRIRERHATILYDNRKGKYTLVSSEDDVKVNNRNVRTRILEGGDVINIEGTTLVFDDGKV